ncbi:isocitrate lyase/phosphoenolpyruvate mutase family protein [Chryseobacterium sp. L7]|uniref:Isocitrate lyase/phosphoenolpyruvate mutase family protein n=1 Tax=Chryseobacterium endalhagicum TaxID=2797638 RepID=A0ABS1QD78_9FLAO|nr:isocitrate lyase/phosphoenolpyruvate mutase family protein [Chryseobacterium endalhagicum]MBL1220256.1 isocitrate lyase/phosphoenolpyruvate mutase family protein [Chryseobacterium endalhagicum]
MNQYQTFYDLHHQAQPLLIANAWNVKSAQIIEKAGFSAIATSSGAIASSLGYNDGEQIPFEELLYIVKRIKANTNIPLTVDLERGYTNDLEMLHSHIQQIIDIGAAGINLEDNQGEDIFLEKLKSITGYLTQTNQKLFINARTDVFVQKLDNPVEIAINRGKLYKDAGADGLFVIGLKDAETVKKIVSAVELPLNVVGVSTLSSVDELADFGVKRISMAGMLYGAGYGKIDELVSSIKKENSLSQLY